MSREYWIQRAKENDLRNLNSENEGIEKLRDAFTATEETLLRRIEDYYRKYAVNGEIPPAEGRVRLTPEELNAFRKKVLKLSSKASTQAEKEYLQKLSRRIYISRQEALLAEVRHYAVELGIQTDATVGETLGRIYLSQESHQHYNMEQLIGLEINFESLSSNQVQTLIHQGYNGENFSERIWTNTQNLVKNLNTLLPQQFLLGRSTQDLAKELSKVMNTPRYSAERVIRTEGSNIASQADVRLYKATGVDTYEFLATLDGRTSDICQDMDGRHFRLADAQAGVNLPPMHVNCRSTTLPDVSTEDYDETRLAKGADGKYVVVPKQSYSQWKQKHAS